MQVGLHKFHSDSIDWLISEVELDGHTRQSLARGLCAREGWINRKGGYCVSAAVKALPVLAKELGLRLPEVRSVGFRRTNSSRRPPAADFPDTSVRCGLRGCGEISLDPVGGVEDRREWESMVETHHPQGWSRAPGCQMRYWVRSSRWGTLGGIGFSSSDYKQRARDEFIGWSADDIAVNLPLVVCNHRFLILPGVRVHGLASRVLRMACDRIASDWDDKYGYRPVLAYTYIGPGRDGRCYRAARWRCCPQWSSGRRSGGVRRSVWMKPLCAGWRDVLLHRPRRVLGSVPQAWTPENADWAELEYGRCQHTDGRVRDRIVRVGRAWEKEFGATIPVMFPDVVERTAVYRLLSNERVTMEHILEPHQERTVDRCRVEPVVLAVQDTTTVNYDGHNGTQGLVGLGGRGKGVRGLVAHFGLALTTSGRPLGLFELNADFRGSETGGGGASAKESGRWLRGFERARELDAACTSTRVITLCDREGDFWEMLRQADPQRAGLLVRSNASNRRKVVGADGATEDLWKHVAARPPLTTRSLKLGACGGNRARKARTVKFEIRAVEVLLVPPHGAADKTPVRMMAVSATETPGGKADNLHWLLLTTEGLGESEVGGVSPETARTIVHWYSLRWKIETFFKTLKSGARIEGRRLDDADDLRKCLVLDAVTSVRLTEIECLAREKPDLPADKVVSRKDIAMATALDRFLNPSRARGPPPRHMTIREFAITLGRIVGSHPRKSQPLPGTKKIWEGYIRLKWAVRGNQATKLIGSEEVE